MQGNILNPESLAQLFLREEGERLVVIHTAGIVDITGQMSENLRRVNVTGTKNILALCMKYHVDKDVLRLAGRLCGKKEPVMLPMPLVRAVEPALGLVSRLLGLRPLYTKYSLDTVCTKIRFSARKAREELGYTVRPIRETVEDTVRWLLRDKDISQND